MIFFFSGSGNSETVAGMLAGELCSDVVNISSAVSLGQLRYDARGETVGFVVPVYFRGLPRMVESFCDAVEIRNPGFTFAVFTCSGDSGKAGEDIGKLLGDRLPIDAFYDLVMPDSAPFIKSKGPEGTNGSDTEISRMMQGISEKRKGDFRQSASSGSDRADRERYLELSDTSNFSVTDMCVGCKMCGYYCPEHIIRFFSPRPAWDEPSCSLCMRCVNICPRKAIHFGGSDNGERYLSDLWKKETHDYMIWRLHQKIPPLR